jgi:hypothetical protein
MALYHIKTQLELKIDPRHSLWQGQNLEALIWIHQLGSMERYLEVK